MKHMVSLKQNDIWNENMSELRAEPVQWKTGRAKRWMDWIIYGDDKRTAKEKFEESRVPVFPDKEHSFPLKDFNRI